MSEGLVKVEPAPIVVAAERSIEELVAQSQKIRQAMEQAMEVGHHYGKIPGTPKPTLLKPGAEKLCLLFRLDPQYHSEPVAPDLGAGGHLTIKSVCTLWHIPTGQRFGSGEASCSTRETKYAYRTASRLCPTCGKDAIFRSKQEWGGGWYCNKKRDGCGAKYQDGDAAIEAQAVGRVANIDLADSYNTVLKIANKRALVAVVLNVTAASDLLTQDIEDFERGDELDVPTPPVRPAVKTPVAPGQGTEPVADQRKGHSAPEPADPRPAALPREGAAPDDAPLDETLERSLLLAQCKAAADARNLNAKQRAAILDQYGIRDPREASLDSLVAMREHLRGLEGAR